MKPIAMKLAETRTSLNNAKAFSSVAPVTLGRNSTVDVFGAHTV